MRIVLASNNAKKLKELSALMGELPIELVTQASLGVSEAEEPHASFVENALAKARHAAAATGLPALADDSGLCVHALGGHPGVQSAVFAPLPAGPDAEDREARRARQDAANNALLLQRLAGQPAPRAAHFVSLLVAVRTADDPEPLIALGRWPGEVLTEPRGAGGFGYDPLVWIPEEACTVAELPAERKNQLSHRARAAVQLVAQMREAWRL